eukprot:GILI01016816.1.p1 GENE.GILI01016816.1~~GILI01016816.1.p1  ORF type:complete len:387 (+),score=65.36 GILI01016816.1:96-1256(+)
MGFGWLLALLGSASCFALADVICDITIKSNHPSEKEVELDEIQTKNDQETEELTPQQDDEKKNDNNVQLTGAQDAAIASTVSFLAISTLFLSQLLFFSNKPPEDITIDGTHPLPQPSTMHYLHRYSLAIAAGPFGFFSYFFLLRSFESASSTVILPLLQVCSVWMLFATAIQRTVMGLEIGIRLQHLVAYSLILVGGLLPAAQGRLKTLLEVSFWKQRFVHFALISEVCYGMYNMFLNTYATEMTLSDSSESASDVEFLVLSRLSFVLTFACLYLSVPSLRLQLIRLRLVSTRYIFLSCSGEMLALLGFFLSSYAYKWYYQVYVVHAAESSLNQLVNLWLALLIKRVFGLGRSSSISHLTSKVVSFFLVAGGLFLAALEHQGPQEH